MVTKYHFFHQKSEGILHLLFAGIACKIHFLMPSNFDEKMPLNYDKFCPLKMMAFMIIKGNIICWHFLKALPSAENFHCILREITVYFSDEVFSLNIWGHFIQQCRYSSKTLLKQPWNLRSVFWFLTDHAMQSKRKRGENTYRESRTQSSPEEIQFSYGNLELYWR